jgi:hypothetical protein
MRAKFLGLTLAKLAKIEPTKRVKQPETAPKAAKPAKAKKR